MVKTSMKQLERYKLSMIKGSDLGITTTLVTIGIVLSHLRLRRRKSRDWATSSKGVLEADLREFEELPDAHRIELTEHSIESFHLNPYLRRFVYWL